MTTLYDRFFAKVRAPHGVDGCWEWTGSTDYHGYGRLQRGRRGEGVVKAHRLSYEIHKGPIPDGLDVLHTCDNPPCANPYHLKVGSHADNMHDMAVRERAAMKGCFGVAHPCAVWPTEAREEVFSLYEAGLRSRRISRATGIPRSTVRSILSRRLG